MQPIYTKNRIIGLLGGSFNPAHEGHLHITLHALNKLGCDAVWWLVSPSNPLKSPRELAPYAKRLELARERATDRRIIVSDMEQKIDAHYSYETLRYLKQRHAGARFVWLMGADNLAQFHRWKNWRDLVRNIPIVVFDRAPYSHSSPRSKTWIALHRFALKNTDIIGAAEAPGGLFVHLKRSPQSATLLRKKLGKRAFLGHN